MRPGRRRWRDRCVRRCPRRYSRDRPRLGDTLDVIKFVCKDFWQAVFHKQVDNLKTNHRVRATALLPPRCGPLPPRAARQRHCRLHQQPRPAHHTRDRGCAAPLWPQGIYVLQDNTFRWLLRLAPVSKVASEAERGELLAQLAQPYLALPCGILRGAFLHGFHGWDCPVMQARLGRPAGGGADNMSRHSA